MDSILVVAACIAIIAVIVFIVILGNAIRIVKE